MGTGVGSIFLLLTGAVDSACSRLAEALVESLLPSAFAPAAELDGVPPRAIGVRGGVVKGKVVAIGAPC